MATTKKTVKCFTLDPLVVKILDEVILLKTGRKKGGASGVVTKLILQESIDMVGNLCGPEMAKLEKLVAKAIKTNNRQMANELKATMKKDVKKKVSKKRPQRSK